MTDQKGSQAGIVDTTAQENRSITVRSEVFATSTTSRTWQSLRTELMGGRYWYGFVIIAVVVTVMALVTASLI